MVDLPSDCLLGPKFETMNQHTFRAYIESLKVVQAPKLRLPRAKKLVFVHELASDGRCTNCGKKPRKITSKCDGTLKKDIDDGESPV